MIVTPIVRFCNCSIFCCALLYVHSSFSIILKRELVALFSLSSWCLVIVGCLFLVMPWVCLQFVIVVFSDHTHLLFYSFDHCICNKVDCVTYDLFLWSSTWSFVVIWQILFRQNSFINEIIRVGHILSMEMHL